MPGSCPYPIDRGFAFVIVSDTPLVSKQNRVVEQKELSQSSIVMGYEMLKGLTKKLFGRGTPARSSEGFFLNVRCSACGEVFNLFINKSTDLAQNFDERGGVTYSLNKEIIGGRCRNVIHVNMEFDGNKKLASRKIENGEFIESS
jgi:hypothetical protein